MIAFSTDWQLAGDHTFILGFTPFDQVERVTSYAAQHGLMNVGVLAPNNEYGSAVVTTFEGSAKRQGMNIPHTERFSSMPEQIQQSAQRFAAFRPASQAVLIPAGGTQAISLSQALTQSGQSPAQVRRLGTGLFEDSVLAQSGALEGAWFAAPDPSLRQT